MPKNTTVINDGGSGYSTSTITGYAQSILDGRTNHRIGKIAELHNKIDKVDKYIKNGHDTTAFIYFKVNNFELDTRSVDTFEHYAISLENQKTGVGQGNQFKLKIAYHKDFSNYKDINRLEEALATLRDCSLFSFGINNTTDVKKLNRNYCVLKYGYLNSTELETPYYIGLLLKYSVTANRQIVEYTLEGYTGENVAVNTVNWYPAISGIDYENSIYGKVAKAIVTPKNSGNKLSDKELQDYVNKLNTEYTSGITFQPYLALDCFIQDYNNSLDSDSTKFYLLDCTNKHRNVNLKDNNALESVHMSLCKGQTPLQYIEYCIGLFKYKDSDYAIQYLKQELKSSERFVYSLIRHPSLNVIYVCIDVIDDTDSDNKVAYNFLGYSPDNSLLIDYNLNYDGTVALTVSDMYNKEFSKNNDTENSLYIGNDGAIRARTSITKDMFVSGEISDVLIAKQNTWIDKISCANNCSMTTFGLPFEITVGTVFKCGIYISESLHHTSGNCFVTGITDTINNNSFKSSFTMIRLPGKNSLIKDSGDSDNKSGTPNDGTKPIITPY